MPLYLAFPHEGERTNLANATQLPLSTFAAQSNIAIKVEEKHGRSYITTAVVSISLNAQGLKPDRTIPLEALYHIIAGGMITELGAVIFFSPDTA